MDQAISMAAQEGCAARIDFAPLRLEHVPVPHEWRIVVADSCIRAEKSGAARASYNLRRAQCEEALAAVTGVLSDRGVIAPGDQGYPELIAALGTEALLAAGAGILAGDVARRFRHVVSEASRVADACTALRHSDLDGFGSLMDASHASLAGDYDVSIPELDTLVALAREGGAMGARLTGAGFGGCIVALADAATAESVVATIRRGYHEARGLSGPAEDQVFVAVPSGGAEWIRLNPSSGGELGSSYPL